MDGSLSGSSVHKTLQTGILEWAAIPFSPGDLSNPGIKPRSPTLQADSLLSKPHQGSPKYKREMVYTQSFFSF